MVKKKTERSKSFKELSELIATEPQQMLMICRTKEGLIKTTFVGHDSELAYLESILRMNIATRLRENLGEDAESKIQKGLK